MRFTFLDRFRKRRLTSALWAEAERQAAKSMVMFVHGLGSTADATWTSLLPLLLEDQDLRDVSFAKYEYPTSKVALKPWKRVPSLRDLADGLSTEIKLAAGARSVIVIAHSMGGLITRRLAVDQVRDGRPLSIRRALLLATPNTGATLAAAVSGLFPRHAQTRILAPFSPELELLNDEWVQYAVEKRIRFDFVAGGVDHVVTRASVKGIAGRALDDLLIQSDHGSITKPLGSKSSNYKLIKRFILGQDTLPIAGARPAMGDPTFSVYRTQHEPYYLHRSTDRDITRAFAEGHCWIVGPSGTGKTVAATRTALVAGASLYQVYLGSYQNTAPAYILSAIYMELADRFSLPPATEQQQGSAQAIAAIRNLLRSTNSQKLVCLLIEELPLKNKEDFLIFGREIETLIESLNSHGLDHVRIVITTIPDHGTELRQSSPKLTGLMRFVSISKWQDFDLKALILKIEEATEIVILEHETASLIASANGKPRIVKDVIRQIRAQSEQPRTIESILSQFSLDGRL